MNYIYLRDRQKIDKYIKYKQKERSNITNTKKEKEYEYFLCDYCSQEIKIENKKHEMSGGICTIPQSLTKRQPLKVVLHNKCLRAAIKELEDNMNIVEPIRGADKVKEIYKVLKEKSDRDALMFLFGIYTRIKNI